MNDEPQKITFSISKQNAFVIIALAFVIGLSVIASVILNPQTSKNSSVLANSNENIPSIKEVDGKQIVSIFAKDGFKPNVISLKSGTPTVLSAKTDNTYDCSNTISIPELKIVKALPVTGETLIDIPSQPAGKSIIATCGMGHYPLTLNFI